MSPEAEKVVLDWAERGVHPALPRPERLVAIAHQVRGANYTKRDILLFSAAVGAPSATPALAWFFGGMGLWQALAVIVSVLIFKAAGSLAKNTSVLLTPTYYKDTEVLITRITELLDETEIKNHTDGADHAVRTAHYIEATLSIVESLIRRLLNAKQGSVTVTFAKYSSDRTTIDIRYRNRGSIRTKKEVEVSDFILGHRVCASGSGARVVHDLKLFPEECRRSPTRGAIKYRSFFIFPVRARGDQDDVIGFVSIDCDFPYAFYGNRATVIPTVIDPLVRSIAARIR